jgi:hypothetical protein
VNGGQDGPPQTEEKPDDDPERVPVREEVVWLHAGRDLHLRQDLRLQDDVRMRRRLRLQRLEVRAQLAEENGEASPSPF